MKKIVLVIILSAVSSVCFAETIIFKSGVTVDTKIIEKTDKYIKVEAGSSGTVLSYPIEQIESIDGKKLNLSDDIRNSVGERTIVKNIPDASFNSKESHKSYNYQPKNMPITISVPRQWFVKEDIGLNNTTVLYLSREQIIEQNDFMQVGISIIYSKDDKILQDISFVPYSAELMKRLEKQGFTIISPVLAVEKKYGYPAIMISVENKKIKMVFLILEIGNDLLQLTAEAPLSEAAKYSRVFSEILDSLKIRSSN